MIKKIFLLVLLAFSFQSCEKDESLDPRAQLIPGMYARLNITSKVIKSYDVENSYFGGLLTSPSGTIVKYNLYVKRRNGFGVASDYGLVQSITSFPHDLKIKIADIATALNVPATDLAFGDEYLHLMCQQLIWRLVTNIISMLNHLMPKETELITTTYLLPYKGLLV